MFVIEITYKVPLEEIDKHFEDHVAFLEKYFAKGTFLLSGRKMPREGGIILAAAASKEIINNIIKEDPFYEHRLADIRVIEFTPGRKADGLQQLILQTT